MRKEKKKDILKNKNKRKLESKESFSECSRHDGKVLNYSHLRQHILANDAILLFAFTERFLNICPLLYRIHNKRSVLSGLRFCSNPSIQKDMF